MTDDHSEGTDLTATAAQSAREATLTASPAAAAGEAEWDPPMVPFAIAGMAIWAVIGMALLPFSGRLAASGHGSWLWTCLAGFLLGVPGLLVMIRHDAHRRR